MIEFIFVGQIISARHLLIDEKIVTIEELSFMNDEKVENLINENFDGYFARGDEETIYLVPKGQRISKMKVGR